MQTALQILNYVMWFFIAIFLVVGILSIVWKNSSEKRILCICTIISAGLIFAISVVRLFIAIDLGENPGKYIVFLPIWLYATFIQLRNLKNIANDKEDIF